MGGEMLYSRAMCKRGAPLTRQVVKKGCVAPLRGRLTAIGYPLSALWTSPVSLRILKFDGAIAPRGLKFDSGFAAEGCGERLIFIEGALL